MRNALPALLILLLTLGAATPPLLAYGLTPMGFLLGLAALTCASNAKLSLWVMLGLSLLADSLSGNPLGIHGVTALLMLAPLERYARNLPNQPVMTQSLTIAAALLLMQIAMLLGLLATGHNIAWQSAAGSWLITLPLIPLVVWIARHFTTRA